MTPQKPILPPFEGCICRDPNCIVPRGLCHCGCGKSTTIPYENDKSTGAIKGVPRKYLRGHSGVKDVKLSEGMCICGIMNCPIPFGICHCGCGGTTRISSMNNTQRGWIRGRPIPFISNHAVADRPDPLQRECPDGAKVISLTLGKVTIVDDCKHELINSRKWHTVGNGKRKTPNIYAGRVEAINGERVLILMHREILGLAYSDDMGVDHINGNGLDNRSSNLRLSDPCQNAWNQGRSSRNTSGYKGVSWNKKEEKWIARIAVRGQRNFLGYFATAEGAYLAYCEAAKRLHGEFVNLG